MPVKVCGLNCSLKSSDKPSNTSIMMQDVVDWMREHDEIEYEELRVADYNVKPGVEWDEGDGDEWPHLGERVLAAEVLLFGTPIWIGHPSSIAQRVIERMDAWLFSYDELGRKKVYGRVAGVAITGNEDGGHHVYAECAQALNDIGFVLPPESRVYWTGWTDESPGPNYASAGRGHKSVQYMGQHMARNLVVFAHAMRELTPKIMPLPSDIEVAEHPEEALARAKKLHES